MQLIQGRIKIRFWLPCMVPISYFGQRFMCDCDFAIYNLLLLKICYYSCRIITPLF